MLLKGTEAGNVIKGIFHIRCFNVIKGETFAHATGEKSSSKTCELTTKLDYHIVHAIIYTFSMYTFHIILKESIST